MSHVSLERSKKRQMRIEKGPIMLKRCENKSSHARREK
uniref:Uncharacterized protein n=1 Tax=Vitis vinifera TaxID=29760 RepID=F6HXF6_VITVI